MSSQKFASHFLFGREIKRLVGAKSREALDGEKEQHSLGWRSGIFAGATRAPASFRVFEIGSLRARVMVANPGRSAGTAPLHRANCTSTEYNVFEDSPLIPSNCLYSNLQN